MANSLELRVPLLDHKILEFAAAIPSAYKVKGLATKRILKRSFENQIPREIIKRKKTGFPVPYGRWLSRELKSYTHDLLTSQKAVERGIFRKEAVEAMLKDSTNQGASSRELFACLVLELWHQQFVDARTSASNFVAAA
jgi:asparagine synthase (glutamine-hydrolysing)